MDVAALTVAKMLQALATGQSEEDKISEAVGCRYWFSVDFVLLCQRS